MLWLFVGQWVVRWLIMKLRIKFIFYASEYAWLSFLPILSAVQTAKHTSQLELIFAIILERILENMLWTAIYVVSDDADVGVRGNGWSEDSFELSADSWLSIVWQFAVPLLSTSYTSQLNLLCSRIGQTLGIPWFGCPTCCLLFSGKCVLSYVLLIRLTSTQLANCFSDQHEMWWFSSFRDWKSSLGCPSSLTLWLKKARKVESNIELALVSFSTESCSIMQKEMFSYNHIWNTIYSMSHEETIWLFVYSVRDSPTMNGKFLTKLWLVQELVLVHLERYSKDNGTVW